MRQSRPEVYAGVDAPLPLCRVARKDARCDFLPHHLAKHGLQPVASGGTDRHPGQIRAPLVLHLEEQAAARAQHATELADGRSRVGARWL